MVLGWNTFLIMLLRSEVVTFRTGVKTKHGGAAFSCYSAHVWNKLLADCRCAPTLTWRLTPLCFTLSVCTHVMDVTTLTRAETEDATNSYNINQLLPLKVGNVSRSGCRRLISPVDWQLVHTLSCQLEPFSSSCWPAPSQVLCSVQFCWAEMTSEKVLLGQT